MIFFLPSILGPKTDEEGRNFTECIGSPVYRCNLHLSQQLSSKFPSTRSIPITSSKSAIGIVMGSGNMGHSLKQKNNVFVSADAGLSWHQVLKGSYYFNLGKNLFIEHHIYNTLASKFKYIRSKLSILGQKVPNLWNVPEASIL